MSGTPVIGPLTEGLAGATPIWIRGVLNATVNSILDSMSEESTYAAALDSARRAGLAEPDPTADVDGHDSVAKVMVLSALVFGRQLRVDQVSRRGISDLTEIERSQLVNGRVRELATLRFEGKGGRGEVSAEVTPAVLDPDDLLTRVSGTANALICEAEPLGRIAIGGPGAGLELAGQGVLSDLIAVRRST